jgi:antitoxin component YwqK of YwqJK toxin-antitoxin module
MIFVSKYLKFIYLHKIIIVFCISMLHFVNYAQNVTDSVEYKIFYFADGTKSSEGTLINGKPDKYWKTYDKNGILRSEGNRKNFELDSLWKFYDANGKLILEINYFKGKKNGIRKTYQDNEIIFENFENDVKSGLTVYYYPDMKVKRELNFVNGRENGISKEFSPDGLITGIIEYKNGFIVNRERINRFDLKGEKHGVWKEFWENDKVKTEISYNGGKKNGYYKEYDKNGSLIKLFKYVNDSLVPDASEIARLDIKTEYYSDGSIKKRGSFKGDIAQGVMREYSQEGKIIKSFIYNNGVVIAEGIVDEKGLYQGFWKEFYLNGNIKSEGEYKNGKKTGKWKYYHENGKIEQEGSYNSKGNKQGKWIWYYPSGNLLRDENYLDGFEDGLFVEYTDSGSIIAKGEFVEGLEEGFWIYNTGDERIEGNYIDGNRDGVWKIFYSDGKLAFSGYFSDDNPDGKHIFYYPNGKIKEEGFYVMGLKHGNWRKYNELDGMLFLDILYRNGIEKKYNGMPVKPDIN